MENKRNIPQVGKVTLFKPRVGKVISGQTTGGLRVIIPNINVSTQFYNLHLTNIKGKMAILHLMT